jgi:hypothetical protein
MSLLRPVHWYHARADLINGRSVTKLRSGNLITVHITSLVPLLHLAADINHMQGRDNGIVLVAHAEASVVTIWY